MNIERLRGEKNLGQRGFDTSGEGPRTKERIESERQRFAGRLRMALFGVTVRILRKLSQKTGRGCMNAAEQNHEILDRLNTVLSCFPQRLRDLLTGSKDAAELFELLEGTGAGDVNRISEAVSTFQRRQEVQASKPVGRNAPCPCGSEKKFKHCCGQKK